MYFLSRPPHVAGFVALGSSWPDGSYSRSQKERQSLDRVEANGYYSYMSLEPLALKPCSFASAGEIHKIKIKFNDCPCMMSQPRNLREVEFEGDCLELRRRRQVTSIPRQTDVLK